MKNIVFIDEVLQKKNQFNAGSKARRDVTTIVQSLCKEYYDFKVYRGIHRLFCYIYQVFNLVYRIKNQNVIIQYPFVSFHFLYVLLYLLKKRNNGITLLIHDIVSIRDNNVLSTLEKQIFNLSDNLIVHTQNMHDRLKKEGIISKMKVLGPFDYLSSNLSTVNDGSIVFAGNLTKSGFLKQIGDYPITLNLYGVGGDSYKSENINYRGIFYPDDLSQIQGSWGLVWDGSSCKSCKSNYGEYLKINSPHKLSMYLAAGLPVIVWKESGLSRYVLEKKIGFCINSINEINNIINSFSSDEIENIRDCVKKEANDISSGNHLKSILLEL